MKQTIEMEIEIEAKPIMKLCKIWTIKNHKKLHQHNDSKWASHFKHPRITAAALLAYTYNTWIGKVHLNLRKITIGANLVPTAQWFINVALEKTEKHKNRITPQYNKKIRFHKNMCEKEMMTWTIITRQ